MGKVIHRELCKKFKFDEQVVYAQSGIRPGEQDIQNSLGFCDTNRSPNLIQTTSPSDRQKREPVATADHR